VPAFAAPARTVGAAVAVVLAIAVTAIAFGVGRGVIAPGICLARVVLIIGVLSHVSLAFVKVLDRHRRPVKSQRAQAQRVMRAVLLPTPP
jgi:hypothetical protein